MGQGERDTTTLALWELVSGCSRILLQLWWLCYQGSRSAFVSIYHNENIFKYFMQSCCAARQPWHDLSSTSNATPRCCCCWRSCQGCGWACALLVSCLGIAGICIPIPVSNLQAELVPSVLGCHYVDFILGNCQLADPSPSSPLPLSP